MSHNQIPTEALMKNLPEKSTHDRQEEEEDVSKRSKTTHESEPAAAKEKAEPKLVLSYTPSEGWGIRFKHPWPPGDRDTSFSISSLYANVDDEKVEQSVNADEMDPEVKLAGVDVVMDADDDVEKKDVQMPVDDVEEGVDDDEIDPEVKSTGVNVVMVSDHDEKKDVQIPVDDVEKNQV